MRILTDCFAANRAWAARMREREPDFFERLHKQQKPELLWIGCSDSRLPPNEVIGRPPGEIFVHRNVANLVVHTDVNALSVLHFGIHVLGIRHVIVCGHYGCSGIAAATESTRYGLADNWLRHVRDVYRYHHVELDAIADMGARRDRLAELNVAAQVANVCHSNVVQDAWHHGQDVAVHGWIYGLNDGLLRDLGICIDSPDQIPSIYRMSQADPTPVSRRPGNTP
jgi:carbonic anhydrase